MTLEVNKVGSILVASEKQPEPCKHHWHRHPDDGCERETITTGEPRGAAICCHCAATGHVALRPISCGPHAKLEPPVEDQKACCVVRSPEGAR